MTPGDLAFFIRSGLPPEYRPIRGGGNVDEEFFVVTVGEELLRVTVRREPAHKERSQA